MKGRIVLEAPGKTPGQQRFFYLYGNDNEVLSLRICADGGLILDRHLREEIEACTCKLEDDEYAYRYCGGCNQSACNFLNGSPCSLSSAHFNEAELRALLRNVEDVDAYLHRLLLY